MRAQFDLLNKIRGIASDDKLVLLTLDGEDMLPEYFHMMRSSAEVVIDLSSEIIGGALKRQLLVTRFLRGWSVAIHRGLACGTWDGLHRGHHGGQLR